MPGALEVPVGDATFTHNGGAGALGAGEETLEAGEDGAFEPKKQPKQAEIAPTDVNASLSSGEASDEEGVMKRKESVTRGLAARGKVPKLHSLNGAASNNSESRESGEENKRGGKEGDAVARRASWHRAVEENEAQQKLEQERLENARARATEASEVHGARKKELMELLEHERNDMHAGRRARRRRSNKK